MGARKSSTVGVTSGRGGANSAGVQGQLAALEDCWSRSVTVIRPWQASSHTAFFADYAFRHTATLHSATELFLIQWLYVHLKR
jgi:hypothetical protein